MLLSRKLRLIIIACLICCGWTNTYGQETLFFDDFESGAGNWTLNSTGGNFGSNKWIVNNTWTGSVPSGITNTQASTNVITTPDSYYLHVHASEPFMLFGFLQIYPAQYHTVFDGAKDSQREAVLTNAVSTLGKTGVKFSFWWVCNADPTSYEDHYGSVYYSTDNGTNWSLLSTYWGETNWTQAVFTNSNFDNKASLKFKFEWRNQSAYSPTAADPPFAIDDVMICVPADDGTMCIPGTPPPPPPPPLPTANITNVSASETSWCRATKSLTVNFTASGTFNAGNQFIAELSDATGSFASPTTIGTLSSTATGSLSISATVPVSTSAGTGYRIRVRSTDIATTSTDNGTNITILATPTISIPSMPTLCDNANAITIPAFMPPGGTYSGTGVSGTTFDPQVAGSGSHVIKYSATNSNGCTGTDSTTIVVSVAPTALFDVPPSVCVSGGTVALSGTPSGGTFSGTGVSGTTFDPSIAGVGGPYTITYTVNDATCDDAIATRNITVSAAPTASFTDAPEFVCVSGGTVTLTANPSGGTFSGTGVSGTTFDPLVAGVGGPYAINYNVNIPGCGEANASHTITVNAVQTSSFTNPPSSVCISDGLVTLTATPSGGTFSGIGVSGTTFDPSIAGEGLHTITYTVADAVCGNATTPTNITVSIPPTISFTDTPTSVCISGGTATLTATPSGGTFSGIGVSGTTFDPSIAGANTHTITYTVNDATCGIVTETHEITVTSTPTASFTDAPSSVCVSGGTVTLTANPSGGTFSGNGVSGTTFDPSVAGVGGPYAISYKVTIPGCGETNALHEITVTDIATASFTNAPSSVCISGGTITLTATPSGGTFSGNGVSGTTFDPSVAGIGGPYAISYKVNIPGCGDANALHEITVVDAPTPKLSGDGIVCQNASTDFTADITGGTWSSSNVNIASIDPISGKITAVSGGTATMTYTITTPCLKTETRDITVTPLPNAGTITGPTSMFVGAIATFHPSINTSNTSTWTTSNTDVATIDNGGKVSTVGEGTVTIFYIVENECGKDTAKADINVVKNQQIGVSDVEEIKIPSAFSPDGDNVDDKFVIVGLENFPGTILHIYNEWGSLVYQSNDYKNDWDGYCQDCLLKKGGLPTGTYFYVLDMKVNGIAKNYKGFLYLER